MVIVSNVMTNAPIMATPKSLGELAKPTSQDAVKGILKAELKRRGLTYADLVERLAEHGITETEPNLRNKISRGAFTATFFVQCLVAIGCEVLQLPQDPSQ